MNRLTTKAIERIANNLVEFMSADAPLQQETILFIYNWIRRPEGAGTSKMYLAVWDMVLKKYLPKERPVLFRSCLRLSKCDIQSFTGKMHTADRFSDGHKGHVLICDTKEYLQFEDAASTEHLLSYFPLSECVKRAATQFSESFREMCEMEDEYIVRVNYNWLYDLKWNKKSEE